VRLKSLNWNTVNGWIVCGGENGLLKVLKLDSGRTTDKSKGMAAPSNLSMNQTLEGHNGSVMCVCWNENYRKLTTSDQYGLIIVWMLHKGMWFEEMINNRNKSTVRGMKWTSDGQRICIIYEDGAVIVGSVDGNRLWGKELKTQLAHVQWSPDGRNIIFCTLQCEVHIYDAIGNYMSKMNLYCLDDAAAPTSLIGIDWYDGAEGLQDPNQPTLAIGMENGRLQLQRHEADESPVLIDTGMSASSIKWNTNGSVLAVSGNQAAGGGGGADRRDVSMVQFYSAHGQHLRTLKVPGSGISALSWEGGSLRVALAVDSYIYFANIRPDYRWGFFGDTLVCAHTQPERSDSTVMFWNTKTDEHNVKYVKQLLDIKACAENCVLAHRADDNPEHEYVLVLCNAIGSPLALKYIDVAPTFLCITAYHVCAASADFVYVWQYRTLMGALTSVDSGNSSLRRKEGRERSFHIDDAPSSMTDTALAVVRGRDPTADPIVAVAASPACLLVARESGALLRYSLPHITLEHKYALRCRPQKMAINCDTTRMSIIDVNGALTFFDLATDGSGGEVAGVAAAPGAEPPARFERKDVWDMRWADDNPELFALMEKTRMYIFRGLVAEEPSLSSAYICSFSELEIRAVLLDQLMREPEERSKDHLLKFETKSLREARELLEKVSLADAYAFVEGNAHPRLWRLLAEAALQTLELGVAEKAFVHYGDYVGIQFVKRLQLLDDPKKQTAEVATYFGAFDDAEKLYVGMDRKDLALELRSRLGDWFKVVQLVQQGGGDDSLMTTAWNKIGDHFWERQRPAKAVQYYGQAKNAAMQIQCLYQLEDYAGLEKLIGQLPDGSPLLREVGEKFASVGMATEAVAAFVKSGDVKSAIDSCVQQHHWEGAVALAEQHAYPDIQRVLSQYAQHLLDSGQQLHAVALYRKANQFTDAARLLTKLAKEAGASRVQPLRAKKLFVMAAMEVERMRKKMLSAPEGGGTQTAAQTLDSLVNQDKATGGDKWLDSAWKGAEAYHFLLLAQRQLYAGYQQEAMRTALRLREYESVLSAEEIYSLVALTAFYSRFYNQCSKAFIKLQSSAGLREAKAQEIGKLALSVFTRHTPADPGKSGASVPCPNCGAACKEWDAHCGDCGTHFAACVISGRAIFEPHLTQVCRGCKHRYYESEVRGMRNCALCHTPLGSAPGSGPDALHSYGNLH